MKVKVLNTQTQVEIRQINLSNSIDRSGECLLGRSPHSGIVLDSPDVSRLHAKFSVEDGQYYFYDLGSANGSLVNGKIVQPNQGYLLKSGDIIRLGEFVLILQAVGEQPEELAATIVGNPNATVIGLQPDINWFSNKELGRAPSEQQEEQLYEEKIALAEDFEAQEEEQKENEGLSAEISWSEAENSLKMEEQFSQLEAIEGAELSEPEALEDPELENLKQELVEVEQQAAELFEAESEPGAVEQAEAESRETMESLWTENFLTETIDESSSPESEILSGTEADSDIEINKIQSDEQNSELDLAEPDLAEPDLAESIDPIPDPMFDQSSNQLPNQQIPDPEEFESDLFSEPTLVQLNESENMFPSQFSEWVDSESNSTEIDTIERSDPRILEQPEDLKLLESVAFDSESAQTEASDASIPESDESVESEASNPVAESIAVSESTLIQPGDLAKSESLSTPDSESEFASEPAVLTQAMSEPAEAIEPVEDHRLTDETENLDEVTGLSIADEITGLSAEKIEALDPATTLEQITTESVEVTPLETMEPVEPVVAEADLGKTDVAAVLESQIPELTETSATYPDKYIALLAHDNQKLELIDFVAHHKDLLSHCLTIATHSVSDLLKRDLGFEVSQQTPTIPPDGYQTINSLITSDKILAVIFLRDFFTPQTTQANDEAFSRSCNIRQVMFASNLPTAEAIIHAIRATVVTP